MISKLIIATSLVAAQMPPDEKVKVDLFYESLCPYCKDMISGSFAEAFKADGFLNMAEVNFWPYGNAHQTQSDSGDWEFRCQHGDAECQYNLIETCVINLTKCPYKAFDIINCIEQKDQDSDF